MNTVNSRRIKVLAATVGLWAAQSLSGVASPPSETEVVNSPASRQADEPSRLNLAPAQPVKAPEPVSANQQLANAIASHLQLSGNLKGFNIDIRADNGVVELTGQVADQAQREEALRLVQGVPGVERVRDKLTVASGDVAPAIATTQPVIAEPRPLQAPGGDGPGVPALGSLPSEPMPIFRAPPVPGGMGAGAGTGHMPAPPMPPYAWPTYAPYNNYSRVAYPTLYPYQSWPFIGPMYPFPKVPLGWRSVLLKWQDGHWWYGRTATGHDWWRVRYW
jgi:BON domain